MDETLEKHILVSDINFDKLSITITGMDGVTTVCDDKSKLITFKVEDEKSGKWWELAFGKKGLFEMLSANRIVKNS